MTTGVQEHCPASYTLGVPRPGPGTQTHLTAEISRLGLECTPYPEAGCWATLLTRETYLPGLIVLHYSLRAVESAFPLIVLYTDTLSQNARDVIASLGIRAVHVDPILPPPKVSLIAERFADTWTKLRCLTLEGYRRVVMIDNDMLVLQNMDELFYAPLPDNGNGILSAHGCICNIDRSDWAPDNWIPENCPFTKATNPEQALMHPAPTDLAADFGCQQLNSGLVVMTPDPTWWDKMQAYMRSPRDGELFQFPDQDVLTGLFGVREGGGEDSDATCWRSLSYTYNAVKISRDWHSNHWRDGDVKNLHFICDKPWKDPVSRTIASSSTGRNDENDPWLHVWWWDAWHAALATLNITDSQRPYLESLVAQPDTQSP
ncbi:hypothetical protein PYCC9005_004797 [Savitreella phatthalungensis]